MFAVSVVSCHLKICSPHALLMYIYASPFKSTEPVAGGGIKGPVDKHPAAVGSDSSCAQLGDVHHGCAHVFTYVLQLSMPGSPAYETE